MRLRVGVLTCATFALSMCSRITYGQAELIVPPVVNGYGGAGPLPSGGITLTLPAPTDALVYCVWVEGGVGSGWSQVRVGYPPYNWLGGPGLGPWSFANVYEFLRTYRCFPRQLAGYGLRPQTVGFGIGSAPPAATTGAYFDQRNDEERASAPKIEFDKIVTQPMKDRCWKMTVSGRVSDPGPFDPNGLKLSYDASSGGRQTINVAIGADGSFNDSFEVCPMGDIENVRPLLMYSRSPGDNVNVGYSGSALRFERRRDVLDLRESLQVRVKGMGHFRFRTQAAVMGVRG